MKRPECAIIVQGDNGARFCPANTWEYLGRMWCMLTRYYAVSNFRIGCWLRCGIRRPMAQAAHRESEAISYKFIESGVRCSQLMADLFGSLNKQAGLRI